MDLKSMSMEELEAILQKDGASETGLVLEPSWHGEHCPGNGENGNPCCCDECDLYQACFPDWHPGAVWDEHTQRFI